MRVNTLGWALLTLLVAFGSGSLWAASGFWKGGGDLDWVTGGTNGDDNWDDTSGAGGGAAVSYPGFGPGETATFDAFWATSVMNASVAPANPVTLQVNGGNFEVDLADGVIFYATDLTFTTAHSIRFRNTAASGAVVVLAGLSTPAAAGALTIDASVTLQITGNADFTGLTVANSGAIIFDASSGNLSVTGAGQLNGDVRASGGANAVLFDADPGASTFIVQAGSTAEFSTNVDFTGDTVTNSGAIRFNSGSGSISVTGAAQIGGGEVATTGGANTVALDGDPGAATYTVGGGTTLGFVTSVNFTGDTITNGGTMSFSSASGSLLVTAASQIGGGAVSAVGGANTVAMDSDPGASTYTIAAGTTLGFTASVNFTGDTITNSGIISFNSASGNITVTGAAQIGGGEIDAVGGANSTTLDGDPGASTYITAASTTLAFTASVNFTGDTITNSGIISFNSASGNITVTAAGQIGGGEVATTGSANGTSLDADPLATTFTVGASTTLTFTAAVNFTADTVTNSGTIAFDTTGGAFAVTGGGQLNGAVSCTGGNTLTLDVLTGASTLTLADGCDVNVTGALTLSSTLTVGAGAATTLDVGAAGDIQGGSVAANGILTFASTADLNATLTVDGSVVFGGTVTTDADGTMAGGGAATFSTTASLSPANASFELIAATVNTGVTITQTATVTLRGTLTLTGTAVWDGAGQTLNAGNSSGLTLGITVGTGSVTLAALNVPQAGASNNNVLTVTNTAGTFTITGNLIVSAGDSSNANGSSFALAASSTLNVQGNLAIGTGSPAALADASTLTLNQDSTLTLGVNAGGGNAFSVGRYSMFTTSGGASNAPTVAIAGGSAAYTMTLDGQANINGLAIGGYTAAGLQLTANFGESGATMTVTAVVFSSGQTGGTHLTVTPDLVSVRGSVAAATWTEITFDSSPGSGGAIATAATPNTSSLKISNAADNYGSGFTITATEAENGGNGSLGADNDDADEDENITWGGLAANTLTVSAATTNPGAGNIGMGDDRTFMIANFAAAGSGGSSLTVTSITLTATATSFTDINDIEIWFDTDANGTADVQFGSTQAGAGASMVFNDTQAVTLGTTARVMVVGDVSTGATPGNTFTVSITDASTDVASDATSSGSCASGTKTIVASSGTITAATGNPGSQTATAGSSRGGLQFNINVDAGSGSAFSITQMQIEVQTNHNTSNTAIDRIASVRLYRGNGNSGFGSGDTLISTVSNGGTGWAENTTSGLVTVDFGAASALAESISIGSTQDYWVQISFTGTSVTGSPDPAFVISIDNSAGAALNGGGVTNYPGAVTGGGITLVSSLPGDPLDDDDNDDDNNDSCNLSARGTPAWPMFVLLAAAGAIALLLRRRRLEN